tara:strand:- start:3798 stop:4826 length:1029 start_codon:yes stop_codon:yes gene_type:complete
MDKKTIAINPELFSFSGSKKRGRKPKTKKAKPRPLIKPNVMQKELLKRIKSHSEKNENENKKKEAQNKEQETETLTENEFSKHLDYLSQLKKERKKKKGKKSKKNSMPHIQTATPLSPIQSLAQPSISIPTTIPPPTEILSPIAIPPPVAIPSPTEIPSPIAIPPPAAIPPMIIAPPPPYSNLKNGNKPTYRTWKNKTQKTNVPEPQITMEEPLIHAVDNLDISPLTLDVKEKTKERKNKKKPYIKKTKKKYQYVLGKDTDSTKVGVFIKSNYNRKVIQEEIDKIKKTPIQEVKDYLRKKSLIKVGSAAPNDVLRKMYEDCLLSGEISNQSGENLVHNYLNE